MPATYEPIQTTTLGGSAASISFTSIPSTYTDLRLVFTGIGANNGMAIGLQYNNDTSTNYSTTFFYGNPAASYRQTSQARINLADTSNIAGLDNVRISNWTIDILSYASTSLNKTCIFRGNQTYWNTLNAGVGLWRSTSAIDRIDFVSNLSNQYGSGTTVTLYGIKAA